MAAESLAYAGHLDGVKGVLSVEENLRFWAGIHGRDGDIGAALAAFDLRGLEERAAQNLSAGQRRRLGLARLAVTGRPIWALDEPTVSLDTASVALFARAVEAHLAAGGAAILATHIDLGLAAARELDVTRFRAAQRLPDAFGEAFS
jgi:heme exporter protein A